jgi:hypothetical protein
MTWKKHKDNALTAMFQLEWEAEVVEYVDYLGSKLSVHGNASTIAKNAAKVINKAIPLLGPRFVPPTFFHDMRRDPVPFMNPEQLYIAALTVVHPIYYPTLKTCPKCASSQILWDSWNATGSRTVYGVRVNERAIGYQLRCKDCKSNTTGKPGGYCLVSTNHVFWEKWEHWKIPSQCSIF